MQGKSSLRTHQAFRFSSFTFPIIAVTLLSIAFVVYLQFFNVADVKGMSGSGRVRSQETNRSVLSNDQGVQLVEFAATKNEHGHVLQWVSVDDLHISHYAIERSSDLRSWEPVSTVPVNDGADIRMTYMARDIDPPNETIHYRLKQINTDGSYKDLDVITMKRAKQRRSSIDIIMSMFDLPV